MMPTSYNQDVVIWATEQAHLIRSGRFDQLDIEHIADEVEDVGRSEKREWASRLAVLLAHLLKWQFQPSYRGLSWSRTIHEHRKQVVRKLKETPSLVALLDDMDWVEGVWGDAVMLTIGETGLDTFPHVCPWAMADILRRIGIRPLDLPRSAF